MVKVFYGAADRDKNRFIFSQIAERMPADTILLVPDQYTLQAERNAFKYMNADALLELEIMSQSRFEEKIIRQYGGIDGIIVNKYGRFMLLAKLLSDDFENDIALKTSPASQPETTAAPEPETISAGDAPKTGTAAGDEPEPQSTLFAAVKNKKSFVSLMNDLISEMKQYNIDWSSLEKIQESFSNEQAQDILCGKLSEIVSIYKQYEDAILGKYTDSEDFHRIAAEKIYESERVKESEIWFDGFDYMTPRLMMIVESIICTAKNVNIVLTGDNSGQEDFAVTYRMREMLKETSYRRGIEYAEEQISEQFSIKLEPVVRLVAADDFYSEAESIAIEICELIREKNLRYRDIVIICNDAESRGSVFKRIFSIYGIPLFIDRKKSIANDPAITFIISMLDIVRKKRRIFDVLKMLKTGYAPIDDEACEILENYCAKYNIRSGNWKKPFAYGLAEEGEEKLAFINEQRAAIDEFISAAESIMKNKKTVREKTAAVYTFLAETADMPAKIDDAAAKLQERGMLEYAERTEQIWQSVIDIFDQLVEVMGDETISNLEFGDILKEGFEEVEIGILPTNNDQVVFGTMQRTRTGQVKALFVAGANEGVLPEHSNADGILSDDEKELIGAVRGSTFVKTAILRDMEQQLSLYKNLSKAEELLYISYSELSPDGSQLRPSELVTDMLRKFPSLEINRDIIHNKDSLRLAQTPLSTLSHLTLAMRHAQSAHEKKMDDAMQAAAVLLSDTKDFENIKKGLNFSLRTERIEHEKIEPLYMWKNVTTQSETQAGKNEAPAGKNEASAGKNEASANRITVSASAIERYSKCPFSFFVGYGLRPSEQRTFSVDMRSIGDIYHECLRRLAETLTDNSIEITSPQSRWLTVSEEECRNIISKCVSEFSVSYRDGVFNLSKREEYIQKRVNEICFNAAWTMILQVRSGRVKEIYFERRFANRPGALFPAISMSMSTGDTVEIEGIIDRVDVIAGYDEEAAHEYIKIIDYKSGAEKFDLSEVYQGWRLQLMIYLKGAMGGIKGSKPAGVFYFRIKDTSVDISEAGDDNLEEYINSCLRSEAQMDGIFVENESVIEGIDSEFTDKSEIISLRRKKSGEFSSSSMLTSAEFDELIEKTGENLQSAADGIANGSIDIRPRKGKNSDACTYCAYRSICNISIS